MTSTATAPAGSVVVRSGMTDYDRSVLAGITTTSTTEPVARKAWFADGKDVVAQEWVAQAVMSWVDRDGAVQIGPCRRAVQNNLGRMYDVSPFVGAWTLVHEDRVLNVFQVV